MVAGNNRAVRLFCSIIDGPYEFEGVEELLTLLHEHDYLASMHTLTCLRIALRSSDPVELTLLGMALMTITAHIEHVAADQIVIRLKDEFLFPTLRGRRSFERY